MKNQTGLGEPMRDWFPISFMGTFTDWADLVHGPSADWGKLTCGCHPNCGIGMAVMIDKETKEAVPVTAFLKAEQLAEGHRSRSTTPARGRFLSVVGMALALMKNYDPFKSPTHFKLTDLLKKFDKTFGATGAATTARSAATGRTADIEKRRARPLELPVHRRACGSRICSTTTSAAPSGASFRTRRRKGRSSFCAYNTGVGWRNIIEKMHMTATLTKWYEEHGRHEIFAGGKKVALDTPTHSLVLDAEAVAAGKQNDLDEEGIAKTAREEKLRAKAEAAQEAGRERAHGRALPPARAQGAAGRAGAPDPGARRQEEGTGAGRPAQGPAVDVVASAFRRKVFVAAR